MDNQKMSAILYIAAGVVFIIGGFIGGNIMNLPLGVVLIILGIRKLKKNEPESEQ